MEGWLEAQIKIWGWVLVNRAAGSSAGLAGSLNEPLQ